MKKLLSILALALVAVALLSACKKEVDDRDKFCSQFKITETEYGYLPEEYVITISKSSSDKNEVVITNLFYWAQPGMAFHATISGNRITLPTQNYGGIVTCSASGRLDGLTLDMDAQLSFGGGSFNPKLTGKKL
jgi:hypothetical protein